LAAIGEYLHKNTEQREKMYRNRQAIVLASGSPRRQQYLHEMGLDFTVQTGNVEEQPFSGERPEDFVMRMAAEKAGAVSERNPHAWVIGGDTVVCLDKRILGKPADKEEAVAQLMALSGREHLVMTGFCVAHTGNAVKAVRSVTTYVRFARFSQQTAEAYVATGESLDKAGAYGIQGKGACLVESIDGSYSNVVGLPLCELLSVLLEYNVIEPAIPAA
jgi:septum formation protein